MSDPTLIVKRVFFQNDNSTNPTVEFEYDLDPNPYTLISSISAARLIVMSRSTSSADWAMDNYALDKYKNTIELDVVNDKYYKFTIERKVSDVYAYTCINTYKDKKLYIPDGRPEILSVNTFFNSINLTITPPSGLTTITDYDLIFTFYEANSSNCGIERYTEDYAENKIYTFCDLKPNTSFYITYNIVYNEGNNINNTLFTTKDSLDRAAISTTNTIGDISGNIAYHTINAFPYGTHDERVLGFNLNYEFSGSDPNCPSDIAYNIYRATAPNGITDISGSNLSWGNPLLGASGITALSVINLTDDITTYPTYVYYKIQGYLVGGVTGDSGPAYEYKYLGAPLLQLPDLPTLSIIHSTGETGNTDDTDCKHVLVDVTDVDVEISYAFSNFGGYVPVQFDYNDIGITFAGPTTYTGNLNFIISDDMLNKGQTVTIDNYQVLNPEGITFLDLSTNNRTLTVGGSTSIVYIPYKAPEIVEFNVADIVPAEHGLTAVSVTLNVASVNNGVKYGDTFVDFEFSWYAREVDNNDIDVDGSVEISLGSGTAYTLTTTITPGFRYKFWVVVSQYYNHDGCSFTTSSQSENISKIAQKLTGTIPLELVQEDTGLNAVPTSSFEIYSILPSYNNYTVNILTNDTINYQASQPQSSTFQIKQSNSSTFTNVSNDTSSQTLISDETNIYWEVQSIYTDASPGSPYASPIPPARIPEGESTKNFIEHPEISVPTLTLTSNTFTANWSKESTSTHSDTDLYFQIALYTNSDVLQNYKIYNPLLAGVFQQDINFEHLVVGTSYKVKVTPYVKIGELFYAGLTKESTSVLYREIPSLTLSFSVGSSTTKTSVNKQDNKLNLDQELMGNELLAIRLLVDINNNNNFTPVNNFNSLVFDSSNSGITSALEVSHGFFLDTSVSNRDALMSNTAYLTNLNYIFNNGFTHDFGDIHNNYTYKATGAFTYTDSSGVTTVDNNINSNTVTFSYNANPNILGVTLVPGGLVNVVVENNNSPMKDYILMLTPSNLSTGGQLEDADNDNGSLLYKFNGTSELNGFNTAYDNTTQENQFTFDIPISLINPTDYFVIVSNDVGMDFSYNKFA